MSTSIQKAGIPNTCCDSTSSSLKQGARPHWQLWDIPCDSTYFSSKAISGTNSHHSFQNAVSAGKVGVLALDVTFSDDMMIIRYPAHIYSPGLNGVPRAHLGTGRRAIYIRRVVREADKSGDDARNTGASQCVMMLQAMSAILDQDGIVP